MNLFKYSSFLFCLLFLFSDCQSKKDAHDDHGHAHAEDGSHPPHGDDGHDDHDDHGDHEKMVILNQAQYYNAEVDTGWFELKNISDVIHANGHTELAPQSQAEVSTPIEGMIKSIKVIEGDFVKKGQVLATMHSLEFNNLLLEKAELNKELKITEAHLPYLKQEYERQKTLSIEFVGAKKEVEIAASELNIEQATADAIREQLMVLNQVISSIGYSDSGYLNLTAPISGYVTKVNVKMGSVAHPGDHLIYLVDNSKMHVDLLVYENDLSKVKVGQDVRFILTNQSNKEITGEIYNIGKSFENDSKSVAVHADIDRNNANLIPGMYVNALINIGENKVNTLPLEAVIKAEGREFIWIWEAENVYKQLGKENSTTANISFARLEVMTGASKLGVVEVKPLGEIHDGDKIVTKGAYYLQSHLQKSEGGGSHSH